MNFLLNSNRLKSRILVLLILKINDPKSLSNITYRDIIDIHPMKDIKDIIYILIVDKRQIILSINTA